MRGLLVLAVLLLSATEMHAQARWTAPPEADQLKNPFRRDDVEVIKRGKETYEMVCGMCHGDRGDGAGAAGQTWNPPPANFTRPEVQDLSDGALYWKISEGNPPAMLQYKNLLSEEEIWQLVIYLRQLASKN